MVGRALCVMGIAALILLFVGAILVLAGCASAPRGAEDKRPGDVVLFPDGYDNAATKCDHGNRVYVAGHGIAVVPRDPTCATQ